MTRIPAIIPVRYLRSDLIIEVSHIVVFMGEIDPYVKTHCLHKDGATIPDSSGRKLCLAAELAT